MFVESCGPMDILCGLEGFWKASNNNNIGHQIFNDIILQNLQAYNQNYDRPKSRSQLIHNIVFELIDRGCRFLKCDEVNKNRFLVMEMKQMQDEVAFALWHQNNNKSHASTIRNEEEVIARMQHQTPRQALVFSPSRHLSMNLPCSWREEDEALRVFPNDGGRTRDQEPAANFAESMNVSADDDDRADDESHASSSFSRRRGDRNIGCSIAASLNGDISHLIDTVSLPAQSNGRIKKWREFKTTAEDLVPKFVKSCGPMDILSGRIGRVKNRILAKANNIGCQIFDDTIIQSLQAYQDDRRKSRSHLINNIVFELLNRGCRFLKYDSEVNMFLVMDMKQIRDKVAFALRHQNNNNNKKRHIWTVRNDEEKVMARMQHQKPKALVFSPSRHMRDVQEMEVRRESPNDGGGTVNQEQSTNVAVSMNVSSFVSSSLSQRLHDQNMMVHCNYSRELKTTAQADDLPKFVTSCGPMDILSGRIGRVKNKILVKANNVGCQIFDDVILQNLQDYQDDRRKSRSQLINNIVFELLNRGCRFLKYDSQVDQFLVMDMKQMRDKVAFALRHQNNKKQVSVDTRKKKKL